MSDSAERDRLLLLGEEMAHVVCPEPEITRARGRKGAARVQTRERKTG